MDELVTNRLLLRGWRPEDVESLARINSDPRVAEWLGRALDAVETAQRVVAFNDHWKEHGFGPWAVEERATGRLAGRTGFVHWDDWTASPHDAEIGWTFAPDVWGRGYATEAALAAVDWARTRPRLRKIISITRPDNVRSRRVMEKIGLTYRGDTFWHGFDQVWYGVDLEDTSVAIGQ